MCSYICRFLCSLYYVDSNRNRYRNLQISSAPRKTRRRASAYLEPAMHIRDLRRLGIRPILDYKTAYTIANSIFHSKLDYCNSLFFIINSSQMKRLQTIQKPSKHHRITPVLKSLHWLKVPQRIHYKIVSLTYNTLGVGECKRVERFEECYK